MDKFLANAKYIEQIKEIADTSIEWDRFKDKTILITGATGMIGKFMVDVLMQKNSDNELNCRIIAIGRDEQKIIHRFDDYINSKLFFYYASDINKGISVPITKIDYIVHLASSTHPLQYATNPISTIITSVTGTTNLLDFANSVNCERVFFASSVEIYGENRGDVEFFDEKYCGYIDCNCLRSGYPEGKRTGEALCQAYIHEKNMDIVIGRLSRIFGPTVLKGDSKALSQFINNAVNNQDIVLKSSGSQFYSYTYVGDVVSAIFYCLLYGENGEAYNVSDRKFDITLKELAELIAEVSNLKVIYDLPDEIESQGFSKVTKAIMSSNKMKSLGWNVTEDIVSRLKKTIKILKELED